MHQHGNKGKQAGEPAHVRTCSTVHRCAWVGAFAVPSRTLRSQLICLLVIIHLHACTARKEAVDVAAVYKIMLDADVVVGLCLQEVRKARVNLGWHGGALLGQSQRRAILSIAELPRLHICIVGPKAIPKVAVPSLLDVGGSTLVPGRLVSIDKDCIPFTVAQHRHGCIIAFTHKERVVRRVALICAFVLHISQAICSRCPTSNVNDLQAWQVAQAVDLGHAVLKQGHESSCLVVIEDGIGEVSQVLTDSPCGGVGHARVNGAVVNRGSKGTSICRNPAIWPRHLHHFDGQVVTRCSQAICDVFAKASKLSGGRVLVGVGRPVDVLTELQGHAGCTHKDAQDAQHGNEHRNGKAQTESCAELTKVGCGDRIWLFGWVSFKDFKAPAVSHNKHQQTHQEDTQQTTRNDKQCSNIIHLKKAKAHCRIAKMAFVQFCLVFAPGNSGKKCHNWKHDLENSMKKHVADSRETLKNNQLTHIVNNHDTITNHGKSKIMKTTITVLFRHNKQQASELISLHCQATQICTQCLDKYDGNVWDSKQFIECGEPWPNSGVPVHGYHDLALNHECKPKTLLCLLRQSPHNKPTCPVMRETETWGQHPTALSDVTPQVLNSPFHDNRGQCTWCYMLFLRPVLHEPALGSAVSVDIFTNGAVEKWLVHSCPQNAQPPRRAQSWKHRRRAVMTALPCAVSDSTGQRA